MNRSKLFIGIFVFFILIVITIVLLACTVFVVRSVSVESDVSSDKIDEAQIIESSGLTIGRSIIAISKDKVITSIEKANPYVEVISVSRVFPNKIVVKVALRAGVMLLASSTGEDYVLVDSSLKVLNAANSIDALNINATLVSGISFVTPESGVESLIGSKLTLNHPSCADIIADIAKCADYYNIRGQSFSTLFKVITFLSDESGFIVHIRTNKGVTFVLDKSLSLDVYDQLAVCLNYYTNQEVNIDRTSGYIHFNSTKNAFDWADTLD